MGERYKEGKVRKERMEERESGNKEIVGVNGEWKQEGKKKPTEKLFYVWIHFRNSLIFLDITDLYICTFIPSLSYIFPFTSFILLLVSTPLPPFYSPFPSYCIIQHLV